MTTPPVRRAYADTALGQLHYAEAGAGVPLLLLHQTPRSHDEFREVQPLLAAQFRTVAMDMYGFGLSAKPPAPQTIEQYAAGVLALADALGLDEFAVLGHHTGMFVATEVAAAAAGRVLAAVLSASELADADYRATTYREMTEGGLSPEGFPLDVDVAVAQADGGHLTTLWAKRQPLYPADRPDLLDRFIRDALAPGVDPAEGHLACARDRMEERIGLLQAPVLLLAATLDPVSYPHTARVLAALPAVTAAELVEIPGGRIPLMEEWPEEVASAVLDFLDRRLR